MTIKKTKKVNTQQSHITEKDIESTIKPIAQAEEETAATSIAEKENIIEDQKQNAETSDLQDEDNKKDDEVIQTVQIDKLIIDEFYPKEDTFIRGPIYNGDELSEKIQTFFGNHIIENIIENSRARTGRFTNSLSLILKSINNILDIKNDEISNEEIENLLNEDESKQYDSKSKRFYYFTNIISTKLKNNISRNAKNEFLFIILHCTHEKYGEMVAMMKMEKIFGVQYSSQKLKEQLDLLPDKKAGLHKAAIVFKNKLETYSVDGNYRENNDENEVFHTKIIDKQDSSISKMFIKGFLENAIIHRDQENTASAFSQIKLYLTPYLNINYESDDIENYLKTNTTYGSVTSVNTLVKKVVNESKLVNKKLLEEKELDTESISSDVFTKMLNDNQSASAEFKLEFPKIEKYIFTDSKTAGKLVKLQVSHSSVDRKDVMLDIDIDDLDSINDIESKIFIAISTNLIDRELFKELKD